MAIEYVSAVAALGAGLLSFLSPCVLPRVPVYLASLAGPEVFESQAVSRLPLFLHSLCFVLGFSLVFVVLGAGAGLLGLAVSAHLEVLRRISGGLLIALGVFMLASLVVPWLNFEKRLTSSLGRTSGYLRSFLTGSVFTIAWTPCVGPVLGGILTLAAGSATAWRGAYLLALYSLGLGIPFLVLGLAFDSTRRWLKNIQRYTRWFYLVSGVLLIAIGVLILTDRINPLLWF